MWLLQATGLPSAIKMKWGCKNAARAHGMLLATAALLGALQEAHNLLIYMHASCLPPPYAIVAMVPS